MNDRIGYNLTSEDLRRTGTITDDDALCAGYAVLQAIGLCAAFGHASPAGIIDYVTRPDDDMAALVWDAFASTRGDTEASDRVWKFAGQRGLLELVAEAVTD